MKKLTIKHALKNDFNFIDCIKYFKPDWTDGRCDHYLWEETCYPFSPKILIEQLNNQFINK